MERSCGGGRRCGAWLALGALSLGVAGARPAQGQAPPPHTAANSGSAILGRLGIDALVLSAAGVGAEQVTAMIDAVSSHMALHGVAYHAALARVGTARAQVRRLEGGAASADIAGQLAAARGEASQAEADWQAEQQALVLAAEEGLSDEIRQRLERARANRKWSVPIEYAVVDRSDTEWKCLAAAIRAVEEAAKPNAPPASHDAVALVTAARAHVEVASAIARVRETLAAVRVALAAADRAASGPR